MSVTLCYGCKKVSEEEDCERPTTILVAIEVGEQDE